MHWKTSYEVLTVHQLCNQTLPPRIFPKRLPSSLEGFGLATTKKNSSRSLFCPESVATAFGGWLGCPYASTTSVNGAAAFSICSASKTAVRNLARSWILNLKGRNIRINVISPGVVPTPGYDGLGLTKEQIQGFIDFQENTIPSGRAGTDRKSVV